MKTLASSSKSEPRNVRACNLEELSPGRRGASALCPATPPVFLRESGKLFASPTDSKHAKDPARRQSRRRIFQSPARDDCSPASPVSGELQTTCSFLFHRPAVRLNASRKGQTARQTPRSGGTNPHLDKSRAYTGKTAHREGEAAAAASSRGSKQR